MSRGALADGLAPDPPALVRLLKRLAAAPDLTRLLNVLVARAPGAIRGLSSVEITSPDARPSDQSSEASVFTSGADGPLRVVFHLDRSTAQAAGAHPTELDSVLCLLSRIVAMRSRADAVEHARLLEAEIESGRALLSTREAEVVSLLRDGFTAPAAAERLRISRRTVERHIYHIYRKLGISCHRELFARLAPSGAPPPTHMPFERRFR